MDENHLERNIVQKFVENGGKLTNTELVANFQYLFEGADKEQIDVMKQKIKTVVNRVATAKRQGNVKSLILKKEYRPDEGLLDSPQIAGLQSSILRALTTYEEEPAVRKISPFGVGDQGDVGSSSNIDLSNVNAEKSVKNESNLFSSSPNFEGGRMGDSLFLQKMLQPLTPTAAELLAGDLSTSSNEEKFTDSADQTNCFVVNENDEHQPVANIPLEPDCAQENETRMDMETLNVREPVNHDTKIREIQHRVSVKDRAKIYENEQENSNAQSPAASRASKNEKYAKQKDDSHEYCTLNFMLSDEAKQWLLTSCKADFRVADDVLSVHPQFVNLANSANGYAALHWAAKRGDLQCIKVLVEKYNADLNKKTVRGKIFGIFSARHSDALDAYFQGYTPMHLAAQHDRAEALALLEQYGADTQIRDNSGRLPSQYLNNAYGTRRMTAAEMLHDKNMNVNGMRSYEGNRLWSSGFLDSLNGFGRMGSVRRAGAVALNLLRGQQTATNTSGYNTAISSPVDEQSIASED